VTVGDTATYDVSLSSAPDGLKRYNVTVSLTNGSVGDVGTVGSGDLPNFEVVSRTDDSVTFRAVELFGNQVGSGATDVLLGSVTVNETSVGATDVDVTVNGMVDGNDAEMDPAVDGGSLTVSDAVQVSESLDLADGSDAAEDTVRYSADGETLTIGMPPNGSYTEGLTAGVTYQRDYFQANVDADGFEKRPFPNDGNVDIYSLGELSFDGDTDLGVTQLPRGYDLNVTVVDGSGDPVNATVAVGVGGGGAVDRTVWTAATGPDGTLETHPNSPGIEVNGDVGLRVEPGSGFEGPVTRTLTVTSDRDVTVAVNRTDTDTGDDGNTAGNTSVDVVLTDTSNGLQLFQFELTAEGSTVQSYRSGPVAASPTAGGVGNSSITLRGADLVPSPNGTVTAGDGDVRLATVNVSGNVSESALDLTVSRLQDDNGEPIPTDAVVLDVRGPSDTEPVFTGPLPGAGTESAPTDPDGDGMFEDVDGDGDATFADAIALAFVQFGELDDRQTEAVDFDDDGDADFADAIELAFLV
jgi:hypothetical protein